MHSLVLFVSILHLKTYYFCRIYVDAVINHMSGAGGSGTGTGGTHWDSGSLSFPGVPFSAWDFNGEECPSGDGTIHNYNNPNEVRNCRLVSLVDLKMGKDYVRGKVAEYMNKLIDIGVGGFRIDAAKHMWPGDLRVVYDKLHHLKSDTFGSNVRPFIYQEVIDMGGEAISASEYTSIGRVTNFIFGIKLADVFRHSNPAKYLHNWGAAWGMPSSDDVVVFLDDHDNQRGHGGGGNYTTVNESGYMAGCVRDYYSLEFDVRRAWWYLKSISMIVFFSRCRSKYSSIYISFTILSKVLKV